jgi:dolichol-phosphate mannosyltransferase
MEGGGIKKWPLKRRIISFGATFLGRLLLPDITDPVSGFFAVRKKILYGANIHATGYKILLEILGKSTWEKVKELPYEFTDRQLGSSKLKVKTIIEYALQVMNITLYSFTHHKSAAWREWTKIFKFGLVGASGIAVNTAVLFTLKEFAGFPLMVASFIAIELSIISNFYLNDKWTFKHTSDVSTSQKLYRFHIVSFAGLVINMGILFVLTNAGVYYLVANIIGIFFGFTWNFIANRRLTWRKKS